MILKIFQVIYKALTLLGIVIFGTLYASFFHKFDWRLDLATNFAPQIWICCLVFTIIGICLKDRIFANVNLALVVLYTFFIVRVIYSNNTNSGEKPNISFLSHNLNLKNQNYSETQKLILEIDPDIVLLSEFEPEWNSKLPELYIHYPFKVTIPFNNGHGIALFSKHIITSSRIENFVSSVEFPCILAKVQFQGKPLNVIGVHLNPPINEFEHAQLGRQVEALKEEINKLEGQPVVVLGDFNISPFTKNYRKIVNGTSLAGTAFTATLVNTWHHENHPLGKVLGANLDHILLSPHFSPVSRKVLPKTGSAHNPVFVEAMFQEIKNKPANP
jgi:endonuclease/exonuclease/phosphatase (EEP) superfamily protein YafD